MPRRKVRRSAAFLEQAYRLFPREGSAEGMPSFRLFEQGPLRGAETAFSLNFEAQHQHIDDVGSVRYVMGPARVRLGSNTGHLPLAERC